MSKFTRYSEQKLIFSMTQLSFDAPSPVNPHEYPHKPYLARN